MLPEPEKGKDEVDFEIKLSKIITQLPEDQQTRFKLLKIISDRRQKIASEMEARMRELEVRFDGIKAPLYEKRAHLIAGEVDPEPDTETKFSQQHRRLKDQIGSDQSKIDESEAVKQDLSKVDEGPGIPGFWLRVLKNHHLVQDYVKKWDAPILRHLRDIRGRLAMEGFGMTLEFDFDEGASEYFEERTLSKTYHMVDEQVLERTECSPITWREGKNVTEKEVEKKQRNKRTGEVRTVKRKEPQESFFQFFVSRQMPNPEQMASMEEEKKEELACKIDEDFDLGNDLLNEIIPEAMETYLKVINEGYSDINSSDSGEGDE